MKKCYLCKTPLTLAFHKLGHKILKCPSCGLFSLDFSGNYRTFLTSYYSKGFFTGGKHYRAYADYQGDKSTILHNMKKYLTVIKKYAKLGRLLDLGCAMGFLIEEANSWGYDSFGVDISEYAVSIARKLVGEERVFLGEVEKLTSLVISSEATTGGRVEESLSTTSNSKLNSRVKDSSTPPTFTGVGRDDKTRKFDIVTMFDLIEHLENPKLVLKKIHPLLSPSGILVIQTGDAGSFWAKLMGKNWHFFAPPQHFFFYNQKNLMELLSQAGFKIIKIQKIGKWVSLRYLFHMMRYINKDSIGDIFYRLTAKNFLGQIPLFLRFNDNMIVIAKKTILIN